jgi:hypothetical protein
MTTMPWIPYTAADLDALRHDQLTPRDPSDRLQAHMRRGPDGHIVCQRCGSPVRYGWCYAFGAIVLATCARRPCQLPAPWVQTIRFVDEEE